MNDILQEKIRLLPESPGCYIMKSGGEIIYVGKAVNLKNRVRQYFHGSHTPKVAAMVSRVDDFDLMLCQTNLEALTLECIQQRLSQSGFVDQGAACGVKQKNARFHHGKGFSIDEMMVFCCQRAVQGKNVALAQHFF